MNFSFKIIPLLEHTNSIIVHPDVFHSFQQIEYICFGHRTAMVVIQASSFMRFNELGISLDLLHALSLPTSPEYEGIRVQNHFIIGPYIGLLLAGTYGRLKKKIKTLNNYVEQYEKFKGCIIAFSLDGLNYEENLIKGLIYNPEKKEWNDDVFPFPSVVIRQRVSLSKREKKYLIDHFGNCFINNDTFDKWQMYKWLSKNSPLKDHLPFTCIYTKPTQIIDFLDVYNCCYIKPLSGMEGNNVKKIIKQGDGYIVKTRLKKKNVTKVFDTANNLLNYCRRVFKPNKYIIQQPLELEIIDNHIVDFRLVLVKNHAGKWINAGIISKCGFSKSIVSNYARGAKINLGADILKDAFNCSQQQLDDLYQSMTDLATLAASEVEKQQIHICKYGIDIAIDKQQKVWLIEMNHRFLNDNVFNYVGDDQTAPFIKLNTMLYAKSLAELHHRTRGEI